jgi:hypothetical protein
MNIWKRIVSSFKALFSNNTTMFIELKGNPLCKISENELKEKINKVLLESFDFESEELK